MLSSFCGDIFAMYLIIITFPKLFAFLLHIPMAVYRIPL